MSKATPVSVREDSKPQLVTNSHKKLICFQAKFDGRPYREMSEHLSIPISTLMSYFSREWKQEYEEYAREETEWRMQAARKAIQNQIFAAAREVTFLLHSPSQSVRLNAAKYILDRTVGEDFFKMIDETEVIVTERLSLERKTKTAKRSNSI
jgi:hypothetical protein